MKDIKRFLENQQEVKYLCYFIIQDDRTGKIEMELGTCGVTKKCKFRDAESCVAKLIDLLFELKKLEKWSLGREKK